ncbi:MAG: hypothetical protein RBU30_00620 [Polyangia bacterium]|nr:hypothetical protein [Polyangia bacterium]
MVAGPGNQLGPSACSLASGTLLLAFERLQTASARRIYLKRRRPGFGWSYGKEVPLPGGSYSMQSASLLGRPGDEVLLFAQAGDLRRRAARIWLFRGKGDSLGLPAGQAVELGAPKGAAETDPFAAPGLDQGELLLTVTRRFSGEGDGCYLARTAGDLAFPRPAIRIGPGERCRVVALGGRRLLLAYQARQSLRQPFEAYFRLSGDSGASWSAPRKVASLALESFDPHPVPMPGGAAAIYHVGRVAGRWAIYVTEVDPAGSPAASVRLTPLGSVRVQGPHALGLGAIKQLFFAQEVRPLDFDILSQQVSR